MKKTIGIYIRVSTKKQKDKGYSLDEQDYLCRTYAEKMYPDYEIKIYNDGAFSGGTLDRPGLTQLLHDIKQGIIQIMMFTDLDRLTRGGVAHTEYLLTFAKDYNCEVICLYQNVNISDPDEEFNTYLNSLLASRDRKKISIKTKRGISGGLKKGVYTLGGVMPLGYKREKDKKIVIVDHEAKIIKDIFNYINNKIPIFIIKNKINEKYKILLTDSQLHSIIHNKKYIGLVEYMDIKYTDIIPAIIDSDTWNKAQKTYKSCLGYSGNKHTYLFTNKIECKFCNQVMVNRSGYKKNKKYYYIHCIKCKRWINQEKVFVLLEDHIAKAYYKYKLNKRNKEFKNKVLQAQKNVEKLNNRLRNLQIALLDELINKEDFKKLNKEINKQLKYYNNFLLLNSNQIEAFYLLTQKKQKYVIEHFLDNQRL